MSCVRINKRKYHFIYKTTCSLTSKYYIGMHSTDNLDDGYLGSGRRLRHSIRKYGPENHIREILEFCSSREELASREAEIVNLNEIAKEECMNLRIGGHGGPNSKESQRKWIDAGKSAFLEKMNDEKFKEEFSTKISNTLKHKWQEEEYRRHHIELLSNNFRGKKHSEESKQKMRLADRRGPKNSQIGTMWITNGKENKKIKKEEKIPEGWSKGRKITNIKVH